MGMVCLKNSELTNDRIPRIISADMPGTKKIPNLADPILINPIRSEFKEHVTLDKKDFAAIEYLLRKGQRQLEMYSSPGIRNISR